MVRGQAVTGGAEGVEPGHAEKLVEVFDVIGDHLARVRVTHIKDRDRDPIQQGDILYKPHWSPSKR